MKKFSIAIALALMVIVAGTAIALTYLWLISGNINITDEQTLTVYSDSALTQEITQLNVPGILGPNQAHVTTIYVANTGSNAMNVGFKTETNAPMMILFAPTGPVALAPGESAPVEVTFYIPPSPAAGNYNFSIIVIDADS